jgi:hypothetical protein
VIETFKVIGITVKTSDFLRNDTTSKKFIVTTENSVSWINGMNKENIKLIKFRGDDASEA